MLPPRWQRRTHLPRRSATSPRHWRRRLTPLRPRTTGQRSRSSAERSGRAVRRSAVAMPTTGTPRCRSTGSARARSPSSEARSWCSRPRSTGRRTSSLPRCRNCSPRSFRRDTKFEQVRGACPDERLSGSRIYRATLAGRKPLYLHIQYAAGRPRRLRVDDRDGASAQQGLDLLIDNARRQQKESVARRNL